MVYVQQAVAALVFWQGDFRKVDRGDTGAVVAVARQLFRHLHTDIFLGFYRTAADMGRQKRIIEAAQGGQKLVIVGAGLYREHIDAGTAQMSALQAVGQGINVDHRAAGCIDQDATRTHLGQLLGADQVLGGARFRDVQAYDVRVAQQVMQAWHLPGVTQWQFVGDIVKLHLHTQALRKHTQLHANVAVADNAQFLATNFKSVSGGFLPLAAVGSGILFCHAAQQQYGFGEHQFGDAAGVGKGRIEYHHAAAGGGLQIDLVGTYTETAHGNELFGGFENLFSKL